MGRIKWIDPEAFHITVLFPGDIYRAEANDAVDFAPQLLEGLRMSYDRKMKFSTVIHQATAFTHQRRISWAGFFFRSLCPEERRTAQSADIKFGVLSAGMMVFCSHAFK